jgi:hypothetical protein
MSAAVIQLRSELQSRFDVPFEVRKRPDLEQIPTGIPAIDGLTGGGIPKGTLTEICGLDSTGRTALIFAVLGRATRRGECCAWIDTEGVFDPVSAAEAGVELDRVLWVNCAGNAQHALKATDLLIQAGGFGLVVLDMGDTPMPWRGGFRSLPGSGCGRRRNGLALPWSPSNGRSMRGPARRCRSRCGAKNRCGSANCCAAWWGRRRAGNITALRSWNFRPFVKLAQTHNIHLQVSVDA